MKNETLVMNIASSHKSMVQSPFLIIPIQATIKRFQFCCSEISENILCVVNFFLLSQRNGSTSLSCQLRCSFMDFLFADGWERKLHNDLTQYDHNLINAPSIALVTEEIQLTPTHNSFVFRVTLEYIQYTMSDKKTAETFKEENHNSKQRAKGDP